MYELSFTTGFQNSLERLSRSDKITSQIQHCFDVLRVDPYQQIPNAKRLQGGKSRFRIRLGDLRILYRIEKAIERVIVFAVGQRQDIYENIHEGQPLSAEKTRRLIDRLETKRGSRQSSSSEPVAVALNFSVSTEHKQVLPSIADIEFSEVTEWITEEELWLLKVPEQYWTVVLNSSDAEAISDSVPNELRQRIESYVTSPASSQIGRVYSLGDDGVQALLERPLYEFLTALDAEQHRVIQTGLNRGPYLVRGGPGTGKSLIGLHATLAFVKNRRGEYPLLPGEDRPRFGVLTYTKTLSTFNESLIKHIAKSAQGDAEIVCSTLDAIVHDLALMALGRKPQPRANTEVEGWMRKRILPRLDVNAQTLVERLGLTYIVEEFEKVIHDYDIDGRDAYLVIERRGRQIPLHQSDRETVWSIYERYRQYRERDKIDSWSFMRKLALSELRARTDYPRFNALFVDEVQDLSLTSRRLILALVRDPKFLLLTDDPAQSLYIYPPKWADVDSSLRFGKGRSFILRRNYRTTIEIYRALEPLRADAEDDESKIGRPMPQFSGPQPVWLSAAMGEHPTLVASVTRSMNQRYPLGNMAVIVRNKQQAAEHVQVLRGAGIKAVAVNREQRIDLAGDAVHVITAHSSKGLEFPVAIVPNVADSTYPGHDRGTQTLEEQEERVDAARRLLYVALSRACRELVMITDLGEPSRFEEQLDRKLWSNTL